MQSLHGYDSTSVEDISRPNLGLTVHSLYLDPARHPCSVIFVTEAPWAYIRGGYPQFFHPIKLFAVHERKSEGHKTQQRPLLQYHITSKTHLHHTHGGDTKVLYQFHHQWLNSEVVMGHGS